MKKRILLVSDVKGWGGWVRGEYIQKYLSDEFDIYQMDASEFVEYEKKTNIDYFNESDFIEFKEVSEDKSFFNLNNFVKYFRKKKIKYDYDLVYFLFHTMLVKKSVRRFIEKGRKNITIVTGFPTVKPIFYSNGKNTFKTFTGKCDAIGANNYISLEDLKKNYNGKTFYAPRGVDPEIFYPMSKKPKKPNEDFVIAYVGKPVPEKGLNKIIKPICETVNVKLIINDRNFTNALSPEEMNLFYNKADAYIVASTIDGTPNPALEAAACGKPIISNHIGNMPEFIKNGYNGFLIKKENERNVNKYIHFVKRLVEDRNLCFEMGMNARNTILKDWTWEKVTENERRIFREIINNK